MNNFFYSCLFIIIFQSHSYAIGKLKYNKTSFKSITKELNIEVKDNGRCHYRRGQLNKVFLEKLYGDKKKFRNLVLSTDSDLSPYYDCIFLRRQIKRDTISCDISPRYVFDNIKHLQDDFKNITGKVNYVALYPAPYNYDLEVINGHMEATVRVHFQKQEYSMERYKELLSRMQERFERAQDMWNNASPEGLSFRFKIVNNEQDAHFSVKLLEKDTRGPYNKRWSGVYFSAATVAHELAHMLGLDDEYDQIHGSVTSHLIRWMTYLDKDFDKNPFDIDAYAFHKSTKCDQKSFMCNLSAGSIRAHHFYTIFKRYYCH